MDLAQKQAHRPEAQDREPRKVLERLALVNSQELRSQGKIVAIHLRFSTPSPSPPGPLKTDTPQQSATHRHLFPTFPSRFFTFFFSRTAYQQVLRRPGSVWVNRTPQCPKAEAWWVLRGPSSISMDLTTSALSSRNQKPGQVLRRWGSHQLCWEPSPQAEHTTPGQLRRWAHVPYQPMGRKRRSEATLTFSWKFPLGEEFCCLHETEIKLKQNQTALDFSKIVTEQLTGNHMKWNSITTNFKIQNYQNYWKTKKKIFMTLVLVCRSWALRLVHKKQVHKKKKILWTL